MNVPNKPTMCNLKYPILKCDATKNVQSNMQMQHTRAVEIQASIPLINSADMVCSHSIMLHLENPPTSESRYFIPVGSNVSDCIEYQPPTNLSNISSDTFGMEVSLHTDFWSNRALNILPTTAQTNVNII